jgi:hypothetical protein
MTKKKLDLAADLVKVQPEEFEAIYPTSEKPLKKEVEQKESVMLTLHVPMSFRSEFKSWCSKNNTSMSSAIQKAFKLLRTQKDY